MDWLVCLKNHFVVRHVRKDTNKANCEVEHTQQNLERLVKFAVQDRVLLADRLLLSSGLLRNGFARLDVGGADTAVETLHVQSVDVCISALILNHLLAGRHVFLYNVLWRPIENCLAFLSVINLE